MERGEVGQAKVYGTAYGPSLRWSEMGILRMSATFSLSPASYESEEVGKEFGVREDWFRRFWRGFPHATSG